MVIHYRGVCSRVCAWWGRRWGGAAGGGGGGGFGVREDVCVCVCVCVGGGGGARVRMCAWVCQCGYFTFMFCKHTPVGSTLHFTESKKLSLYSNLQIVLNLSSNNYYRIY